LDAAWDQRGERQRESEILRGLGTEFIANQAALSEARERETRQLGALEDFLAASSSGLRAMSSSEAQGLAEMFSHDPFDPVQAELETVVASGQFTLLRDAELRRRLGSWRLQLTKAQAQAQVEREYVVKLIDAARGSGMVSALAGDDPQLSSIWATLSEDLAFRDAAAVSYLIRSSYVNNEVPRLERTINAILEQLEAS
jgi:hypothetical protein